MPSMDSSSSDGDGQNSFERNDDFLDQMLLSISAWPELPQVNPKFPWDTRKGGGHDQMMAPAAAMARSDVGGDTDLLSLGATDSSAALCEGVGLAELRVGAGGVGFGVGQRAAVNQQRFSAPQSYGGPSPISTSATSSGPPTSNGGAPPRQKVRARRGQATDPHSIAERLRRERIAERMKALQELVPNANKTDKASMLDEIIDYVKFLQLQVKVLSMSRLGGAAGVAPLMANMSNERANGAGRAKGPSLQVSSAAASGGGSGVGMTEHQVATLMEEDMGSAMQYLQGKGLCLMPISLASAISTVTHSKAPAAAHYHVGNGAADHHGLDHAQQQHSPLSSSDGKEASSMSKSDA